LLQGVDLSGFEILRIGEKNMADGDDYSSIGPLDETAGKEGTGYLGTIFIVMLVTIVAYYLIGTVANL
jgi:hypothetical protein